jgi:sulfur carrier protein
MPSGLNLQINGKERSFSELSEPTLLSDLLVQLELKADRIAVELNGEIAPRTQWANLPVASGDKIEIVHFVGGGGAL